ncbi:hypothetical protein GCM10009718_20900 [Isoptericola halotolerans]|uniref:Transposase InsO family protein n=1 Tax=Isoptericola halotolerans TaxID=300560 RepID=A0ABX2A7X4_9MICO|nr:transposase InsO family protein [Isoptericola halotolerans]
MADEGLPVQPAARVLGCSESGYYASRVRAPSARRVRHALLTETIRTIHTASRGVYGARRVHAELTKGHGVQVWHGTVEMLMARAGLKGVGRTPEVASDPPGPDLERPRRSAVRPRAGDELWVTDITEHPTREGKVYCTVMLDVCSRRVVGWSIDSSPTAALVANALGMAIENRRPPAGTIIHSDHGVQFGSWAFTTRAKESGLVPSMGSIGDCYDNAVIESFWSRMQVELLNRRGWRTRLELANAIFEYLEIFHNRQRRHSALGWLTPVEFENTATITVA